MPEVTPGMLKPLVAVDAALATDGLNRRAMARRCRVSTKTIQRDHELLRAVTGDRGVYAQTDDGFFWWYSDRRRRVFARWLSEARRRRSQRSRRAR